MAIERIILNDNVVEYDTDEFSVDFNIRGVQYLHYIGDGSKPVLNPKGNTSCYRMFCECKNLKQLDLSSFDTSSVTDMTEMIHCCFGLSSRWLLNISNVETKGADKIIGVLDFIAKEGKGIIVASDEVSRDWVKKGYKNIISASKKNVADICYLLPKKINAELLERYLVSGEVYLRDFVRKAYGVDIKELMLDYEFVDKVEKANLYGNKSSESTSDSKAVSKGNKRGKRLGREELSVQESSAIFHSIDAFPLLSLAGYSGLDTGVSSSFEGVVFIGDHLKDILLEKIDVKDWYIKDVSGTTVVLTADNKIGFAISPDGSKIKTRGLELSKTEKSSIKEMLKNGINDICNIINKPLKVINISNNGSMLQNSYLVESLEEEGSWDLFLE